MNGKCAEEFAFAAMFIVVIISFSSCLYFHSKMEKENETKMAVEAMENGYTQVVQDGKIIWIKQELEK